MNIRLTLCAVALLLAACAGTNFKWEDTAKIRDGMSEAEVIAILGPPFQRVQTGPLTVVTWSYATAFGGAKAVSYRIVNGNVVGSAAVNPPK